MERKTLARWLVVSALACFGLILLGGIAFAQEGTTVQGTQSSIGSSAETGEATGGNTFAFNAGPRAEGGDFASAQQLGSNRARVSQSGSAKSGDPVAGAQVTGVVGGNARVQNSNFAESPSAISGDATFTNTAEFGIGPAAVDAAAAQVSQSGSNSFDLSQTTSAETGDAVAGSQVTGIVGGGEHSVQNQNASFDAEAISGEADAESEALTAVGPLVDADDLAQASQIGDNDAVLSQSTTARSGDAPAGAQITGVVGGSATVQNSNSSNGSSSETGPVTALNNIEALDLVAVAGPQTSGDVAQASQTGDNSVDVTQDVTAHTGDAVAGGQVTGAVGDAGGFFTVQNQQASEDDVAISGDLAVANDFDGDSGPQAEGETFGGGSQTGDNAVTIAQSVDASSGDAVAGAQVAGAVGHHDVTSQQSNFASDPVAESGTVEAGGLGDGLNNVSTFSGPFATADAAQVSQTGDNNLSADQTATAATGDAVAGGQVFGAVANGTKVRVQNQNAASGAEATSSELDFDSVNVVEAQAGVLALDAADVAQVSQSGDNKASISQAAKVTTGDAVGGAQVTGVVSDSRADITVQNSSFSDGSVSESGSVTLGDANRIEALAGPQALDADAAQASQTGDNSLSADQSLKTSSGDAVAGAQVTGIVSGDRSHITVNNQSSSLGDEATSGDLDVGTGSLMTANAGPSAGGLAFSGVSQTGDNSLSASQAVEGSSGDAVAGSQVTGAVAGDHSELTVQNSNFSEEASPTSGEVAFGAVNTFEPLGDTIGPDAGVDADEAQASQSGDNSVDVSQSGNISSGDAVGAAQVTGGVLGHSSTAKIQNQTSCVVCAEVESGSVDAGDGNTITLEAIGPFAEGGDVASASQFGDNSGSFDQSLTAVSGDAVAGSQVTGVVAGAGSDVSIQNQNSSLEALATTGDVAASNTLDIGSLGPSAVSDGAAQVQQTGKNTLAFSQDVSVSSGDAVAGAQVTGAVGADTVTTQVANHDEASEALSGTVDAFNEATGNLTPRAEGGEVANVSFGGDSSFDGSQDFSLSSGDAVAGAQVQGGVGKSAAGATGRGRATGVAGT